MASIPSEREVLGYIETLSNWGRWGPEDQMGTLNFLTPARTAEAARLVKTGRTVTCARPIDTEPAPDVRIPPLHFMLATGEDAAEGAGGSMDFIAMAYHGQTITHLDANCHAFWNGRMYNNRDARLVTARNKAKAGHIELLKNGLVGRGVLLDIARVRGVDWMEPGQGVMPEDVERAQKEQGVEVREGDILFLRTGNYKRRLAVGHQSGGVAGPHAALLPWLHRTGVAVLSSDSPNDVFPREYPKAGLALHSIGIVALGLWLLDNANLEDLTQACREEGRWEFLITINPLRIPGGTGSPVNPIAVF